MFPASHTLYGIPPKNPKVTSLESDVTGDKRTAGGGLEGPSSGIIVQVKIKIEVKVKGFGDQGVRILLYFALYAYTGCRRRTGHCG